MMENEQQNEKILESSFSFVLWYYHSPLLSEPFLLWTERETAAQ
jgi:hypothetical protein